MQSAAEQKGNDDGDSNMNSNSNTNSNTNSNVNSNTNSSGNGNGNGANNLVSSILGALNGGGQSGHSEQDVTTLINLGYSRSQALQALTACGGNVEMAASMLFQSSGGGLGF